MPRSVVSRLTAQGDFVEDVIREDGAPLPTGCIAQRPPAGFDLPRWTGTDWAEGTPQAQRMEAAKASKTREFTERQYADVSAIYNATSSWIMDLILDLSSSPRSPEQTARLRAAQETRAKRDRGHAAVAAKSLPSTTPEAVLAMRWEDA